MPQPLYPLAPLRTHYSVIVVGAGQAGLSLSAYLQQMDVDHLLIEKHTPVHNWRTQRWDAFSLVTPNWQCQLPGWPYQGSDPHGFMVKDEINAWLQGFVQQVQAPVLEHTEVLRVQQLPSAPGAQPPAAPAYRVETSQGVFTANQVVIASGGYHVPVVPRCAERLPASVQQVHSADYRNPQSLPEGAVLVVGSGQSGAQIAEDLHLAGRKVYLAVGQAPRCARFYRGRDVVDWLAEMGYYDMSVTQHPLREGVRDNTNHYVTGRDGGRDIDLRQFAREGMELFGVLHDITQDGSTLHFRPNLAENLDAADATYNRINANIDQYIAQQGISAPPASVYTPVWAPAGERTDLDLAASGITSVVWCIGFMPGFGFVDAPVFNGRGQPVHLRGVTQVPGLYFLGLPWLHTWGSGRFSGIARDAQYLAQAIGRLQAHAATASTATAPTAAEPQPA